VSIFTDLIAKITRDNHRFSIPVDGEGAINNYTVLDDMNGAQRVATLEHLQSAPNRMRATVDMDDVASLVAYAQHYAGSNSAAFASIGEKIEMVVDYHSFIDPSFCEHRVIYRPVYTPGFNAWLANNGQPMGQAAFARHIEQRIEEIATPDPAALMDLILNFKQLKSVNFERATQLSNGFVQLVFTEEDQTRVEARLPEIIKIKVAVYADTHEREIPLRLRTRAADGKLAIHYEIDNLPDLLEMEFDGLVARFRTQASGVRVYFGSLMKAGLK